MSSRLFKDDVIFLQRLLKSSGLYRGRIDGDWGAMTDAAFEMFDLQSQQLANNLGQFDRRSEGHIQTLHLRAQELARMFMSRVLNAGIDARIISGTRTYAEQNALFRKGRFGNPGPRVTNARGGRSNHNFGIAWDIGIFVGREYLPESPLYSEASQVGLVDGLEWGGNWISFQDTPHYQVGSELTIGQIRDRFEAGMPYI